jgi:hypothetical protein
MEMKGGFSSFKKLGKLELCNRGRNDKRIPAAKKEGPPDSWEFLRDQARAEGPNADL